MLAAALPAYAALRDAWEQVTEALGTVQDAVVTRAALTHAEVSELPGASAALLAALDQREAELHDQALARGRSAVADALALS